MILDLSIDDLLTTTRTIRKRLDLERPVERAVIEECLELALQAPNGSNHQQWRWIVVDDRDTIGRAASIYRAAMDQYSADIAAGREQYMQGGSRSQEIGESVAHLKANLQRVPALLVPTLADRFGVQRGGTRTTYHDASQWGSILPAVWNFMLALRSRGLGSAWTTIHLLREREMAELLGIPYETHLQAGLFPIAYTIGTEFRRAARRPVSDVIRYNGW
ncbi:MAG: nitroreductase family protein [Myxococcales bacterium]|nr:nitroreductase family protein [Myxococcales bacterium]